MASSLHVAKLKSGVDACNTWLYLDPSVPRRSEALSSVLARRRLAAPASCSLAVKSAVRRASAGKRQGLAAPRVFRVAWRRRRGSAAGASVRRDGLGFDRKRVWLVTFYNRSDRIDSDDQGIFTGIVPAVVVCVVPR